MDGDKKEGHKWYRYGGMWKNKHEAVSAKKPKGIGVPKKKDGEGQADDGEGENVGDEEEREDMGRGL